MRRHLPILNLRRQHSAIRLMHNCLGRPRTEITNSMQTTRNNYKTIALGWPALSLTEFSEMLAHILCLFVVVTSVQPSVAAKTCQGIYGLTCGDCNTQWVKYTCKYNSKHRPHWCNSSSRSDLPRCRRTGEPDLLRRQEPRTAVLRSQRVLKSTAQRCAAMLQWSRLHGGRRVSRSHRLPAIVHLSASGRTVRAALVRRQ